MEAFDTRAGFQQQLRAVFSRAAVSLDMFDPDFALFMLGEREVDGVLRRFLQGGGQLRLAMHASTHLEHQVPRFLHLLRDYGHRIACRVTGRGIRQLSDSFCIADGIHVVRRFHSDHLRGEAAFVAPQQTELPRERFNAIWAESSPIILTSATGI